MKELKFNKELYSKVALIKAAYNYTDTSYLHLDADEKYYYVTIESKNSECEINEDDFVNEILAQSVRHEVFLQTKNIRELLFARAMATSIVLEDEKKDISQDDDFNENEILKDWFAEND